MFRLALILSGLVFFAPAQGTTAPPSFTGKPQYSLSGKLSGSAEKAVSGISGSLSASAYAEGYGGGGEEDSEADLKLAAANTASAEIRFAQEYVRFADRSALPDRDVFILALTGFEQLQRQGKLLNERYLTVVDFRLPSTRERLWVIDLVEKKVIFKTLVAHGQNSGELYATEFSDTPQSYQSSVGFFLASESYEGKHGLSLRLDGLEPGINGNARDRAIVLHGADYVSREFIQVNGRLGRSQGCPSVPVELSEPIIRTIQGQSCFFIYQPGQQYLQKSRLVREKPLAG